MVNVGQIICGMTVDFRLGLYMCIGFLNSLTYRYRYILPCLTYQAVSELHSGIGSFAYIYIWLHDSEEKALAIFHIISHILKLPKLFGLFC